MEHFRETVQYAADDSNAFKTMELLNDEKQSVEEINIHTEEDTPIDLIREKIEQVRAMATEYHLFINHTGREMAERAIRLGSVLIELKSLVRMSDESWEQWAADNLPFVGERNRQKYMFLSKRHDCHRHTRLGVDRLEMLCSATKDFDGEDPIGAFMAKYGISIDETCEVDLEEFKAQVDVALNREKLEKRNIPVSSPMVNAITRQGLSLDKGLLRELSHIAQAGGDPESHLKSLTTREEKEETEPSAKDMLKEFKTLANKMIRTVDDILKCPDQISKIDPDSIIRLIEKLTELQTAANMNTEEAEAA